jgi:hypothetical protein
MNATNNSMTPDDAQPHNPKLPMVAAEHMGKKLVESHLQELRIAEDVWQKMSESKQKQAIERIQNSVKYAVAGAVNTIVTGGHTALAGTIESIAKKDKIKPTVIIDRNNNSDAMHDFYLADSGAACQILLSSAEQYLGGMDLVEADPDQGQLFRNGDSVLPDDTFLWAINLPLMSGGASLIPAPNRKEAELFARSIREKLYEMDQVDYAKSVYAHLWPLNNGEHMRSYNKGNWEAMINWFGRLCAGEVDVAPVALIGHSPEVPDHEVDYKETDGYEFVGINDHMILDTYVVTKKGMDFVATSLGGDTLLSASSPVSVESALKARAEAEELVNVEFSFAECTSENDEAKGRRLFDVTCMFSPIEHPALATAAHEQMADLAIDLPAPTTAEAEPADDGLVIHFDRANNIGMGGDTVMTFKTKHGALKSISLQAFGTQPCFFEYQGREHVGNTMWDRYIARPAFELTEDHPRIKVTYSQTGGGTYRATCNGTSSTSTGGEMIAVTNLLKKMNLDGEIFEITTLDDIEAEVQMFTVI